MKVLEVKINDLAKEEARKKRENEEKVAQEKKALEDRNNRVASLSETTVADSKSPCSRISPLGVEYGMTGSIGRHPCPYPPIHAPPLYVCLLIY